MEFNHIKMEGVFLLNKLLKRGDYYLLLFFSTSSRGLTKIGKISMEPKIY